MAAVLIFRIIWSYCMYIDKKFVDTYESSVMVLFQPSVVYELKFSYLDCLIHITTASQFKALHSDLSSSAQSKKMGK